MKKLTKFLYYAGTALVMIPFIGMLIFVGYNIPPIGIILIGIALWILASHLDSKDDKKSSSLPEDLSKVTRVEVIDNDRGRSYVNSKPYNKVSFSMQDDDRTLKIFIKNNGKE